MQPQCPCYRIADIHPNFATINDQPGQAGIEDLWYRFALSFLSKPIELLKYSIWLCHQSCAYMI
jgi:hypothetical protein